MVMGTKPPIMVNLITDSESITIGLDMALINDHRGLHTQAILSMAIITVGENTHDTMEKFMKVSIKMTRKMDLEQ